MLARTGNNLGEASSTTIYKISDFPSPVHGMHHLHVAYTSLGNTIQPPAIIPKSKHKAEIKFVTLFFAEQCRGRTWRNTCGHGVLCIHSKQRTQMISQGLTETSSRDLSRICETECAGRAMILSIFQLNGHLPLSFSKSQCS